MNVGRTRALAFVMVVVLLVPMLLACASPAPKASQGGQEATTAPVEQVQEPTAAPNTSTDGGSSTPSDPTRRAGDALGLLLGSGDKESVFASYHAVLNLSSPSWSSENSAVVTSETSIQADVQGKDVHLFVKGSGDGSAQEGIIAGSVEKEYEIVDGKPQESFAFGLTWVMWPLEPVIVLSLASLGTSPAGAEAIDGRAAEVYDVDMAKADPAVLAGVQGFVGQGVTKAAGKVWVDKETGGLLKANLDFETDVNEPGTQNVAGHGAGHFDIEITQVGKVTVSVPAAE